MEKLLHAGSHSNEKLSFASAVDEVTSHYNLGDCMFCGVFGWAMDERTNHSNFGVCPKLKRTLTEGTITQFFQAVSCDYAWRMDLNRLWALAWAIEAQTLYCYFSLTGKAHCVKIWQVCFFSFGRLTTNESLDLINAAIFKVHGVQSQSGSKKTGLHVQNSR